jgi:hypothetical protein
VFSTTNDTFLHTLELAISTDLESFDLESLDLELIDLELIDLESVFHLRYIESLPIKEVDKSVMNVKICTVPYLPNMQRVKISTFC